MLQVENNTHDKVKKQALHRGLSIKKYVEFLVELNTSSPIQDIRDLKETLVLMSKDNNKEKKV
tara:strand:- start:385 stop:573 length:189 start_codon:yes stop_codon:yes gene_type:complete